MQLRDITTRAQNMDLDRVTCAARRALRDKKTRDSLAKTFAQGRDTFARFAGEDPKSGLAKLARDAKVQGEVGALVRSVAETIDTGMSRPRRSRLRRVGWIAAIGVAAAALLRRRRATDVPTGTSETVHDIVPPVNGSVAEPERSLRV